MAGTGRIKGLDGVRGIAALAVVVHHFGITGTEIGSLAVNAFFVLSGFLIVGILHRSRLSIEDGKSCFKDEFLGFWKNRAIRLFPIYYLMLFVTIGLERARGWMSLTNSWEWYASYFQNFYIGLSQPYWMSYAHTWSLAVEQQFYFLFAPLLLMVSTRHHLASVAFILVASVAGVGLMQYAGAPTITIKVLPMSGMSYLAAGGLAALLIDRIPNMVLGKASVTLALGFLAYGIIGHDSMEMYADYVPSILLFVISIVALFVVIASIIRHQGAFTVRLLEHSVPNYLGRISYGIYIVHVPIGVVCTKWIVMASDAAGLADYRREALAITVIVSSIALASLSWHLMERPLLKLKSSRKTVRVSSDEVVAPF